MTVVSKMVRERIACSATDNIFDTKLEAIMKKYEYIVKNQRKEFRQKYLLTKKSIELMIKDKVLEGVGRFRVVSEKGMEISIRLGSKGIARTGWRNTIMIKNDEMYEDFATLDTDRHKFKNNLLNLLNGFRTEKKILENMPELKEFFTPTHPAANIVPMSQIEDVRKQLKGLTVKAAEKSKAVPIK